MRLILQRVTSASVRVGDEIAGRIGRGLLVLAGVEAGDEASQADAAAAKIAGLRIFADREGRTNLTCAEVEGELLVVSQFTLLADASRGRRPSFTGAARPEKAAPLIDRLVERLSAEGLPTASGRFGAEMRIECELDGPFTLALHLPPASGCSAAEALSSAHSAGRTVAAKENR